MTGVPVVASPRRRRADSGGGATEPRDAVVALVAAGLIVLVVLVRLVRRLASPWWIEPYKAPLWWLGYDDGFLRRALPGEVLSWFGPPSLASMTAASTVTAVAGAVGLIALTARLVSFAPLRSTAVVIAVLLLAAPFGLPLLIRDVGRFDAIGVAATALVVMLGSWRRVGPVMTVAAVAVILAVLAASEEFLPAFCAPVAVLVCARAFTAWRARVLGVVVAIAPAAVIAALGVLVPPDPRGLAAAGDAAHAAGVLAGDRPGIDAVTVLGYSRGEQLTIFTQYQPGWLVALMIGGAAVAVTLGLLLWWLMGRPEPRVTGWSTGWLVLSVLGLSVVGVDFLRWWGGAFVGFVAVLAVVGPGDEPRRPPAPLLWTGLVLAVVWQLAPIGPPVS